jgi:hypothetical protein
MRPLPNCGGWSGRRWLSVPVLVLYAVALNLAANPAAATPKVAARDDKDKVFSEIPFAQWLEQGDRVDIPWKVKIDPPQLDDQQRFLVTANVTLDGKHLAKRPPGGELLMLMQIEDSQSHVYQGHASMPLKDMDKDIKRAELNYIHSALVVPGDYRITLAMLVRGNGDRNLSDYNLVRSTLHVAPLKDDPLPHAWDGMKPVEILGKETEMEGWFHPDFTGRLHLPVESRKPVRVELLVNLPRSRSGVYYRQSMRGLLPELKALSQMELRNGVMNITLLDVQHRRAVAVSRRGESLEWDELKAALDQANPNTIDVRALQTGGQEADFVVTEMRRRLQNNFASGDERRSEPAPVLIVLTTPAVFGRDAEGLSGSLEDIHEANVFLVDYHPTFPRMMMPVRGRGMPGSYPGMPGPPLNDNLPDYDVTNRMPRRYPPAMTPLPPAPTPRQASSPTMQMETISELMRPLKPRIFTVENPWQFRVALAAILEDIARM